MVTEAIVEISSIAFIYMLIMRITQNLMKFSGYVDGVIRRFISQSVKIHLLHNGGKLCT